MHYSNLVVIANPEELTREEIEGAVSGMMGESADWWDWYQIGGRWTGLFDGYDPDKDPANIKTCYLCHGTGTRPDMTVANGCNGCGGTGKSVAWPTDFGFRLGDVAPIESVTDEQYAKIHRVVCEFGTFASERFIPWIEGDAAAKFPKQPMPPLDWLKREHAGYLAVIVDNHN